MADFYVDAVNGNDSLAGGSTTPFLTVAHAITQMSTSDTLIVRWATGIAYPISSQITLDGTVAGIAFVAEDSDAVRFDVAPLTYNRAQLPIFDINVSAGIGFLQTDTTEQRFWGIDFQGDSDANEAHVTTTAGATSLFVGCKFRDFLVRGLRVRGGTARECWFEGNVDGVNIAVDGTQNFESCVFYNNPGRACDNDSGAAVVARNCTFINNAGGSYPIAIPADWTLENCLWFDNTTLFAITAPLQTTGNAFTSDSGTFHTTDNYDGTPDAGDDLELDPQLEDEGAQDFHIRNTTLLAGGTANSVPRLFDGTAMPAVPPIGALGLLTLEISSAVADTATQLTVVFNSQVTSTTVDEPEDWTITATGTTGVDVGVISASVDGGLKQVVLTTWPRMSPGAAYLVDAVNAVKDP